MAGTLYVVGTPIGNLGDFSPRAVEVLSNCDFIAAEDTRVTVKLLNHFGIKKPMVSYYEHNRAQRGGVIIDRLLNGENCVLVSDAGMPSGRFTFEGFLTRAKQNRREHLEELVDEKRTMIFYEAPHKLAATLADMAKYWGDRNIALVKELTKIHENVERTTLFEAAQKYSDGSAKGEYVIIIEGKSQDEKEEITMDSALEIAAELIERGMSVNEAAKQTAKQTGFKKSDIYKSLQNG